MRALILGWLVLGGPMVACWGADRPNVLLILADDLGFSDLGCYGGEVETPQLDGLAAGGLRFSQFYNTARCWPTRAALLTGYYAQQVGRDELPGVGGGGQGTRPAWARLLPEMLRLEGYRSYHSGKWHVDGPRLAGGFDRSYSLEDHDRYFAPRQHYEDDRALAAVEPGSGYYATTAIADHALRCLDEHHRVHAERPFFSYVAFTAPHFPLHALPEDIAKYQPRYAVGWEVVRGQRWQRLQALGVAPSTLAPPESAVPRWNLAEDALRQRVGEGEIGRAVPWGDLTLAQRQFQATKMAIHAAMIDRMDRDVGRLLAKVRAMGAWENTVILFLSDNGASAEQIIRGNGHDPRAAPGSGATFLGLGPGWSTVANTPFRLHKSWVHEGGIATPLVVHWPGGIAARGEWRHVPAHVIDLVPTLLEVTRARRFETWNGKPVPPLPGRSLVSVFQGGGVAVPREDLWWYHDGHRGVRVGDWKLVCAEREGRWELYDLRTDRGETRDLAREHPDRVRELEAVWQRRLGEFRELATREGEKR